MNGEEKQEKKQRGIPSPFTVIRLVRFGISAVRTVGIVGAFFANPASAAIWVPVGLFILALFIILFMTGAAPAPGVSGPTPTPFPLPSPGVASDCPALGGQIKTSSFKYSNTTGHCSLAYGYCPPNSRKAKSIDIDTGGKPVIFPTIQGQKVQWFYLVQFPLDKPTDCESGTSNCGIGVVFQASVGSTNWVLHLLHLNRDSLSFEVGNSNESGGRVGTTVNNIYLHINIGSNIVNPANPPPGSEDSQSGWRIPEDLGMCI